MPIIRIDYDDDHITSDQARVLSEAIKTIVSEATHIEDVFVYANSAHIKINIAPVEIFIEMSEHKIVDEDALMHTIKTKLRERKTSTKCEYPINLTLIPMKWNIEI